jgi:hypothetical protein
MSKIQYVLKPIAYAIETTPGVCHVFSNPSTLSNMVDIYEECGYAVFPTLVAQEIDGELSFLITSLRIHSSANELLSLEEFFFYREQNDVFVWSWHLVPGTGKSQGQFVWCFPRGQDTAIHGPVASIHCKDNSNAYLFGSPDDMEHIWEVYRSFDKIPVRTDYTGENISCMVIPTADMEFLRAQVQAKGKTKILSTLDYKEYREIFEDQSMLDGQSSSEYGF